jgi:hypothetical protein
MMVSPNTTDRAETYNVGWYYKNTGTNALPHYTLQQRDFMVNTMIDRGMAGHPALFDYNHDGLLDLVMGHYGFYQSNNSVTVALWLYENTGTATDPRFTLVDTDFGNLAAISNSTSTYDLCPTFGDLDGDGDMDMIVGKAGGGLYYCENTGGTGNASFNNPPILEYQHIDAGSNVQPQLVDVDRDGLLDLLIGGRQGPIQYYKNTGTATNPVFDSNINSQTGYALPTIPLFGNIIPRQIYFGMGDAYTRPMLVPHNGNASLFLSLKSGQIGRFYPVYDANGQINVNIPLIDTVFGNINVNYLASAVIADINGDSKLDYIVGTSRGGCRIYTEGVLGHSPLAVELVENEQPKPFQLFPNPASDLVRREFEGDVTADQLVVLDLLGEPLLTLPFKGRAQDISLTGLPNGMYFVTACHNGKVVQNGKLIIQHP